MKSLSHPMLAAAAAGSLLMLAGRADAVLTAENLLGYWDFNDASNPVSAANISGVAPAAEFRGPAAFSADGTGYSGQAGDRSLDLGANNNDAFAFVPAGSHLDSAVTNNSMAVSFWQFGVGQPTSDSSFWITSPSATANQRGFQAHVPWSDGTIYFDHSGCCDGTQRLTVGGANWANDVWKHYVFQVDEAGMMQIWVDGTMVASAGGGAALAPFDGRIYIGGEGVSADPPDVNNSLGGRIDDFAVWNTALSGEDIGRLAAGASPLSIIPEPAGGLLALIGAALLGLLRRR